MTTPQVIEQFGENTKRLLNENWTVLKSMCPNENFVDFVIRHSVDYEPANPLVKSTISFGQRVKKSVETDLKDGQPDLSL